MFIFSLCHFRENILEKPCHMGISFQLSRFIGRKKILTRHQLHVVAWRFLHCVMSNIHTQLWKSELIYDLTNVEDVLTGGLYNGLYIYKVFNTQEIEKEGWKLGNNCYWFITISMVKKWLKVNIYWLNELLQGDYLFTINQRRGSGIECNKVVL